MDLRDDNLLEAISNYNSLPEQEKERLRPLLDETIERHKNLMIYHTIIEQGLKIYSLNLQITGTKGE